MSRRRSSTFAVWVIVAVACPLCICGCWRSASGEFNDSEYGEVADDGNGNTTQQSDAIETSPETPSGSDENASQNDALQNGDAEPSGETTANDPPPGPGETARATEAALETGGDAESAAEAARPDGSVTVRRDGGTLPADPATVPGDASGTITTPRTVQLLVKDRKFNVEGPDEALRVSYDDVDLLKVLNMEPVTPDAVELMPKWLKDLHGKRLRIRGFMYPPFQETGLTGFALARDNQICCFGRDPKIYDVFSVRLKPDVTTDYIQNRPFDVVGVFHIDPIVEDGTLYQLYRIDDAIVVDH